MNQVYLGLGSNLGGREEELRSSIFALEKSFGELELSPVYETPPWGFQSDQYFLNMCVGFKTSQTAREVLDICHQIEERQGRQRNRKETMYSSRSVDLDVLYYGTSIINDNEMQIPHPRLYKRNFVLYPLADIAPSFKDPLKKVNIMRLKEECNDESVIVLYRKKLLTIL